jgi:hypothetical protein
MEGVRDWFVPVRNLNGWPWLWTRIIATPFVPMRRERTHPWFALIATVDGKYPTRMQESSIYVAPATGNLICYFNDTPLAYWNNRGVAHLRLTKLRNTMAPVHATPRPAHQSSIGSAQ